MKITRTMKSISPVLLLGLLLAACGGAIEATEIQFQEETSYPAYDNTSAQPPEEATSSARQDLSARQDAQGAITIVVTPLNLDAPGETIDFQVALDTHSADLSMNLAELAVLNTDTGLSVLGVAWDGTLGGHHVSGILSFPASIDGRALTEDAGEFVLIIRGLDAEERSFSWRR